MRSIRVLHRPVSEFADVVLGPCPGCDDWQLDYTYEAAATFASPLEFEMAVESILVEHASLQCPRLQDLLTSLEAQQRAAAGAAPAQS